MQNAVEYCNNKKRVNQGFCGLDIWNLRMTLHKKKGEVVSSICWCISWSSVLSQYVAEPALIQKMDEYTLILTQNYLLQVTKAALAAMT